MTARTTLDPINRKRNLRKDENVLPRMKMYELADGNSSVVRLRMAGFCQKQRQVISSELKSARSSI